MSVTKLYEVLRDPSVDTAKVEEFSATGEGRAAWASMIGFSQAVLDNPSAVDAISGSPSAMSVIQNNIYLLGTIALNTKAGMNLVINDQSKLEEIFANPKLLEKFKASTALNKASIPVMTSNTAPSGVASSSSTYNSVFSAWKAFNGSNLNPSSDAWASATGVKTDQWLMYEFPKPVYIFEMSYGYQFGLNKRAPKEYRIECSNDGSNWETAYKGGNTLSSPQTVVNPIVHAGRFKYWRMYMVSVVDTGDLLTAGELQLTGFE